mgnify:CR=1 FL=1
MSLLEAYNMKTGPFKGLIYKKVCHYLTTRYGHPPTYEYKYGGLNHVYTRDVLIKDRGLITVLYFPEDMCFEFGIQWYEEATCHHKPYYKALRTVDELEQCLIDIENDDTEKWMDR